MFIALKKEVRTYSENKYIIIKNNVSGSFRILSRQVALLLFLLKGVRKYEEIVKEYQLLLGGKKTNINTLIKELEAYIVLGANVVDAGINDLNADDIINCRKLDEILEFEFPINIFLKTTNFCDKKCRYCSEKALLNIGKKQDFSFELVEKIFYGIDNTKCFFELTGGEPLLHSQFNKLIDRITNFNVPISLITKATNNYQFFESILEGRKITRICFSLDSVRENCVDYITGKDGTYKNIIECMKIAKTLGLKVDINAVLTTLNDSEMEKMIVWAIENGVSNIHFTTVWPTPEADDLIIEHHRKKVIYSVINQLREKYKNFIDIELTVTECENRCDKCGKALTDVKIRYDGEVSLCNGVVIGNLNDAYLLDIWNGEKAKRARCELMKQMAT